jgi:hypothetical protein
MVRQRRSGLQEELLRLLQPPVPRRAGLLSERVAPELAEIGRSLAGRPAEEVAAALETAIRNAGGTPDRAAVRDFAAQIEDRENPFA